MADQSLSAVPGVREARQAVRAAGRGVEVGVGDADVPVKGSPSYRLEMKKGEEFNELFFLAKSVDINAALT